MFTLQELTKGYIQYCIKQRDVLVNQYRLKNSKYFNILNQIQATQFDLNEYYNKLEKCYDNSDITIKSNSDLIEALSYYHVNQFSRKTVHRYLESGICSSKIKKIIELSQKLSELESESYELKSSKNIFNNLSKLTPNMIEYIIRAAYVELLSDHDCNDNYSDCEIKIQRESGFILPPKCESNFMIECKEFINSSNLEIYSQHSKIEHAKMALNLLYSTTICSDMQLIFDSVNSEINLVFILANDK